MAKITQVINGESGLDARNKINNALASVDTADVTDGAITYAKIQDVSATDKVLGRSTAGAGDVEEITMTAAGRALMDDADAAAQRTTLGLQIGVNVQAYDADTAKLDVQQSWSAEQNFANITARTKTIDTASTSITLNSSNAGSLIRTTAGTAVQIIVPSFASGSNQNGSTWSVYQAGAGAVTFVAVGSIIRSKNNNKKIAGQYSAASIVGGLGTDSYDLVGDLIA